MVQDSRWDQCGRLGKETGRPLVRHFRGPECENNSPYLAIEVFSDEQQGDQGWPIVDLRVASPLQTGMVAHTTDLEGHEGPGVARHALRARRYH